jgi:hypothetical protein
VGITEILSVARSELLDTQVKKVTLLWINRAWEDMFDVEVLARMV